MPSKVIRVDDDGRAFPFELGFEPQPDEFAPKWPEQLRIMGETVRSISPSSIVVASASGDPGRRPIIKHMVPAGDGVGSATLYVRSDSTSIADLAAAALELQAAVLAAVAPFMKDPGDSAIAADGAP